MIYETAKNYKPDLILLGHSYDIENETLERIKDYSKNTVISQWFEDHLGINFYQSHHPSKLRPSPTDRKEAHYLQQ